MQDLLVRLYDLPGYAPDDLPAQVKIKRAIAPELEVVASWVGAHFSSVWESECRVAFSHHPVGCLVAYEVGSIVGFACYDTTARGFFGPMGVLDTSRGQGIGSALLLKAMHALKHLGYVYGIIGGAGPVEFYRRVVDAQVIENSNPGLYRDLLRK